MANQNIIAVRLDENMTIFIEAFNNVANKDKGLFSQATSGNGSRVIEKTKEFLDEKMLEIKAFSNRIAHALETIDNRPDEFEVEFAVKFGTEAGIIISSVNSEASLTIKLKWSKDKNE